MTFECGEVMTVQQYFFNPFFEERQAKPAFVVVAAET